MTCCLCAPKLPEDSCSKHTVCAHYRSWGRLCTLSMRCPCVCAGAKTLDRERQRLSFFQSLRKGASNGGASSPQQLDAAANAPEVAASPVQSKAEAAAAEQLKSAEAPVSAANGHLSSIQEHSELPNGIAKQESPRRLQQQVRLRRVQATSVLLQQLGAQVVLVPGCSSTGPHSLCWQHCCMHLSAVLPASWASCVGDKTVCMLPSLAHCTGQQLDCHPCRSCRSPGRCPTRPPMPLTRVTPACESAQRRRLFCAAWGGQKAATRRKVRSGLLLLVAVALLSFVCWCEQGCG